MQSILGTMTFSDQVDRDNTASMIKTFLDAGHRHLDTAHVYNKGKTEELLGELNAVEVLGSSIIATKVNPAAGGLGADSVNKQFTTSLDRMGVKEVDLLYLHSPDLETPIEETLGAVFAHYEAGRFKRFGLSNYASWQVAEIAEMCARNNWMPPKVYQGMYNAYTRDVERELFPCLKNYAMDFYAYNPLAGGILTGKHQQFDASPQPGRFVSFGFYKDRYWKEEYFDEVKTFVDACSKENIAPVEAAIRWLNHHSDLADNSDNGVILGASSTSQLEQNIQAMAEKALPDSIVDALNSGWETVRPACIKYFRP